MIRSSIRILTLIVSATISLHAWAGDGVKPAFLDFRAPPGAAINVDGKDIGNRTAFAIDDLKPNEIRRLKIGVTFADGVEDLQFVDVQSGQRVPAPLPIATVTGDMVAAIGTNHKMVIFPLDQVPEMARGRGVRVPGGRGELRPGTGRQGGRSRRPRSRSQSPCS